jgi:pimeloyl-ACP methyl ester carboxylesterase
MPSIAAAPLAPETRPDACRNAFSIIVFSWAARSEANLTARTGDVDLPAASQLASTANVSSSRFRPTATSQAAGRAFWERRHERKKDVDPPSTPQTMAAQRAAATEWRQIRGERFSELKDISQPTLVVNGHHDVMIPTISSYTLSQHIPRAQLIIYPDSGHGVLFQFPELFVAHGRMFLDGA